MTPARRPSTFLWIAALSLLLGSGACVPKHKVVQEVPQVQPPTRTDNEAIFHFVDEKKNPITNVELVTFQCVDESCKELTGTTLGDIVVSVNTGLTNTAVFRFPPQPTKKMFVTYIFAKGYIPLSRTFGVVGAGAGIEDDVVLNKKDSCSSTLGSLKVKNGVKPNDPLYNQMQVTLEGTFSGAFTLSGSEVYKWGQTDPHYSNWYGGETFVLVNITKHITFDDGTTVEVPAAPPTRVDQFASDEKLVMVPIGGGGDYSFSFTPVSPGDYTATFTTEARDAKCVESEPQTFAHHFSVAKNPKPPTRSHRLTIELAPYSVGDGIATTVTDKGGTPGNHPIHSYTEIRNVNTGAVLESTFENSGASYVSKGTGANLHPGTYSIYVWAQDDEGNEDKKMMHFTIEGPPVPTMLPSGLDLDKDGNPFEGFVPEPSQPLPFGKDE